MRNNKGKVQKKSYNQNYVENLIIVTQCTLGYYASIWLIFWAIFENLKK